MNQPNNSPSLRIGEYICDCVPEALLGAGSFAQVYKGYHVATKVAVAVKIIRIDSVLSESNKRYLFQEIELLKVTNHPNIVRLLYEQRVGNVQYLVLEYCAGKDLKAFLDSHPTKKLDEDTARHFMCQMVSGLSYLHEQGIVHRDLKPHNMMLTENSNRADLKICDFGFARRASPVMHSILGSPLYMAPEILNAQQYSSKSDLWSVGCIFYEMLSGQTPLDPKDLMDLKRKARDPTPVKIWPDGISNSCLKLLQGLLNKDGKQRMTWEQLFKDPYLQPENLTKSTLPQPVVKSPQPSMKNNYQNPYLDNTPNQWLQHVLVFWPHGRRITFYIKSTMMVSDIKEHLGQRKNDKHQLLIFDNQGKILKDYLPLSHFSFNKTESPMYVISTLVFEQNPQLPPYELLPIPYPSIKSPSIRNLPVETKAKIGALMENCYERANFLKLTMDNIKKRSVSVGEALNQQDTQIKVYQVLRNHLIMRTGELEQAFLPVNDFKKEQFNIMDPLVKSFQTLFNKLRSTEIPAQVASMAVDVKGKNLMEVFNEHQLKEELTKTINLYTNFLSECLKIEIQIQQINSETGIASNARLEKTLQLTEARDLAYSTQDEIHKKYKPIWTKYEEFCTKFQNTPNLSNFNEKETESDLITLNAELEKIQNLMLYAESESRRATDICLSAKTRSTMAILNNMEKIGPILTKIDKLFAEVELFQKRIPEMVEKFDNYVRIMNLPDTFVECLKEIKRRNGFSDKLKKLVDQQNEHLHKLRQKEIAHRISFYKAYSNRLLPKLTPYLLQDENHIVNSVPDLKVEKYALEKLPILEKDSSISIEDEFSFVYNETIPTAETVQKLETENNQLLERIAEINKKIPPQSNSNTSSSSFVASHFGFLMSKIQQLEEEVKTLKAASTSGSSSASNADAQIKQLIEQKNHLQDMNKDLKNDLSQCKEKIAQLTTENKRHVQDLHGLKDRNVAPVDPETEKINNIIKQHVRDNDLQYLTSMGFPRNRAIKALVLNENDLNKASNWIFEQKEEFLDAPITLANLDFFTKK